MYIHFQLLENHMYTDYWLLLILVLEAIWKNRNIQFTCVFVRCYRTWFKLQGYSLCIITLQQVQILVTALLKASDFIINVFTKGKVDIQIKRKVHIILTFPPQNVASKCVKNALPLGDRKCLKHPEVTDGNSI